MEGEKFFLIVSRMRGKLATFNVANLVLGISVVKVFVIADTFHLGHAAERERERERREKTMGNARKGENKRGASGWNNNSSLGSVIPPNFTSRLVPSSRTRHA